MCRIFEYHVTIIFQVKGWVWDCRWIGLQWFERSWALYLEHDACSVGYLLKLLDSLIFSWIYSIIILEDHGEAPLASS